MQTHPAPKSYGPFPVVQPSHLAALTQEQRLSQAKHVARARSWSSVHDEQFDKVLDRRFTGEPMTDYGCLCGAKDSDLAQRAQRVAA